MRCTTILISRGTIQQSLLTLITNAGTINYGGALVISPVDAAKSVTGQGGGNVGNIVNVANGLCLNAVTDPDLIDFPVEGSV